MATDAAETRKSMRTRSVNTEILFNLSSSRNITESLKTFGATERDTDILLCSIDKVNILLIITGMWINIRIRIYPHSFRLGGSRRPKTFL
jgi:tRNA threonylcarbamoyladenosine modification (KEOPS) complex Cgi121 subunit